MKVSSSARRKQVSSQKCMSATAGTHIARNENHGTLASCRYETRRHPAATGHPCQSHTAAVFASFGAVWSSVNVPADSLKCGDSPQERAREVWAGFLAFPNVGSFPQGPHSDGGWVQRCVFFYKAASCTRHTDCSDGLGLHCTHRVCPAATPPWVSSSAPSKGDWRWENAKVPRLHPPAPFTTPLTQFRNPASVDVVDHPIDADTV